MSCGNYLPRLHVQKPQLLSTNSKSLIKAPAIRVSYGFGIKAMPGYCLHSASLSDLCLRDEWEYPRRNKLQAHIEMNLQSNLKWQLMFPGKNKKNIKNKIKCGAALTAPY